MYCLLDHYDYELEHVKKKLKHCLTTEEYKLLAAYLKPYYKKI